MMTVHTQSVMRHLIFALVTAIATVALIVLGGSMAAFSSAVWSASMVIAMRDGINAAPRENWKRNTRRLQSLLLYGILVSLICAPALLVSFLHGMIPAVASAWVILATISVSNHVLDLWFGPVANPYADEPRIAREQPATRFRGWKLQAGWEVVV